MVQLGENAGFNEKCLGILGASDSFRVWQLDGDRAVEVVVVSEIDPSEPALTEPTDDPIPPNFGGIDVGEVAQTLEWQLRAGGSRHASGLIRRAIRNPGGRLRGFRFRRVRRLIHCSILDDDRSLS
jgi:hypothetical protein